jgi:ketosteroid isomerase-like protein
LPARTIRVHLTTGAEKTPEDVAGEFGGALRAGDVERAVALFSREACFLTPDATVIHGRPRIRNFLHQLVDLAEELTIGQRTMLTAGDVALGKESWSMLLGRGEAAVRRTSRSTIVLGRIEGIWKIAVVDPWRS